MALNFSRVFVILPIDVHKSHTLPWPLKYIQQALRSSSGTDDAPDNDEAGKNTHRKAINQKASAIQCISISELGGQTNYSRQEQMANCNNDPLADTEINSVEQGDEKTTTPINY